MKKQKLLAFSLCALSFFASSALLASNADPDDNLESLFQQKAMNTVSANGANSGDYIYIVEISGSGDNTVGSVLATSKANAIYSTPDFNLQCSLSADTCFVLDLYSSKEASDLVMASRSEPESILTLDKVVLQLLTPDMIKAGYTVDITVSGEGRNKFTSIYLVDSNNSKTLAFVCSDNLGCKAPLEKTSQATA